jgi:hypothetical protein
MIAMRTKNLPALAILTLAAALSACAGNGPQMPAVSVTSGPVVVPLNDAARQQQTAQPMPGGTIGPPPGMEPSTAPAPQPGGRSGTYAGIMEPLSTGGGDLNCMKTVKITGWHVYGNRVRFGSFHGTIDANDGLQMGAGGDWIIGQFDGATFHGTVTQTGGRWGPGCSFIMNLQRVGP